MAIYSPTPSKIQTPQLYHVMCKPKGQTANLRKFVSTRIRKFFLNVEGREFETSVSMLMARPRSVLGRMISSGGVKPYIVDNVYTYFLGRNPNNFNYKYLITWEMEETFPCMSYQMITIKYVKSTLYIGGHIIQN